MNKSQLREINLFRMNFIGGRFCRIIGVQKLFQKFSQVFKSKSSMSNFANTCSARKVSKNLLSVQQFINHLKFT
jgi:hypothetical protein